MRVYPRHGPQAAVPTGPRQGLFSNPLCWDTAVSPPQEPVHQASRAPSCLRRFSRGGPVLSLLSGNPGHSGNCQHPAESCLLYWVWCLGENTPLYFYFQNDFEEAHFRYKYPPQASALHVSRVILNIAQSPKVPAATPLPGLSPARARLCPLWRRGQGD